MRVFFRLLNLLCQLIGYVFLFITIIFRMKRAQVYRKKCENGDDDGIMNAQKKRTRNKVNEEVVTIPWNWLVCLQLPLPESHVLIN